MIYLDHHATTPVDARVLEAMLPFFTEKFGNAASRQHRLGWDAQRRGGARAQAGRGADRRGRKEIVFTSGATEANNLAIKPALRRRGAADRRSRGDGRHRAQGGARPVPRARSTRAGGHGAAGRRDGPGRPGGGRARRSRRRTALVSVMAANNEIGVLQPIDEIAAARAREGRVVAHRRGAGGGQGAVRCRRARRRLGLDQRPQGLRAEGRRRACMCAR